MTGDRGSEGLAAQASPPAPRGDRRQEPHGNTFVPMDPPRFVDPRATPFAPPASRGDLPHLYKPGGTYFVTFRLADAVVPRGGRAGEPTDPEEAAAASEPPLTLGSCSLQRPEVARLVAEALPHFHGQRYYVFAWCVMPNHVHVLVAPLGEQTPATVLHSWKGFTSHRVNVLLGRRGRFWEPESFDHLIRTPEHFLRFVEYTERNPVAAGLCARPQDWPWSSAAHRTGT